MGRRVVMSVRQRVTEILDDVIKLATSEKKLTGFCIGNTRKEKSTGLYFTPIRNTIKLVAGSVIVCSVEQAKEIAAQVDGKVDYVFVDTEKKVSPSQYTADDIGNVERSVREVVEASTILTFKGNDITVNWYPIKIRRIRASLCHSSHRTFRGKEQGQSRQCGNILFAVQFQVSYTNLHQVGKNIC